MKRLIDHKHGRIIVQLQITTTGHATSPKVESTTALVPREGHRRLWRIKLE